MRLARNIFEQPQYEWQYVEQLHSGAAFASVGKRRASGCKTLARAPALPTHSPNTATVAWLPCWYNSQAPAASGAAKYAISNPSMW